MTGSIRVGLVILAIAGFASPVEAAEVVVELSGAWVAQCRTDGSHRVTSCDPRELRTISPVAPRGAGVIDFDATGQLIRGELTLEAYTVNTIPVPAWSGEILRGTSNPVVLADDETGWPTPNGRGSVTQVNLARFVSEDDFSGSFFIEYSLVDLSSSSRFAAVEWTFQLSFRSVSASWIDACAGERPFLDDDGDGELNSRDASPDVSDTGMGNAVDSDGLTPVDFCRLRDELLPQSCDQLDFLNDEPLRKRPGDCRLEASNACRPAVRFDRSQGPALRTCMAVGVVDDADGDGEPDGTDRCAATPSGTLIDGDGCSAPQFCRRQDVRTCGSADFRNDEPSAKRPSDCVRTQTQPRACTATTSN